MKKLRITPLNLVTALGLCFLVYSLLQTSPTSQIGGVNLGTLFNIMLGALIVVSLITDLIFRFILKELKRIWVVEMFFIVFTVVLFLILQK